MELLSITINYGASQLTVGQLDEAMQLSSKTCVGNSSQRRLYSETGGESWATVESCHVLGTQEQLLVDPLTEWISNTQDDIDEVSGTNTTRNMWRLTGTSGSESPRELLEVPGHHFWTIQTAGGSPRTRIEQPSSKLCTANDRMKVSCCPLERFGTSHNSRVIMIR